MADYIYSIILLIIALTCIELGKTYQTIPKSELRYRAREGDKLAAKLYNAVSYDGSLEVLLWIIITLCLAGSIIIFNRVAPLWLSFIAVAVFTAVAFAWLPKRRMDKVSQKLALAISPVLIFILNYLHPYLKKLASSPTKSHTRIYDKKDLTKLIDLQKKQPDNRIDPKDLELIKNGLKLPNKTVSEYSRSWSKIHHTLAHEAMGPILLDELHKSGQMFVPVLEDSDTKKVIGMINLSSIDISRVGEVRDLMDQNVYYLSEDDSLVDALNAIVSTASPVFIVLDKKDRVTGMITLKDVLSQLVHLETKPKVVLPDTEKETKE